MSHELIDVIRGMIKEAEAVAPQPQIHHEQNAAMAAEQQAVNAAALQSGGTVEAQQIESLKKGLDTPSAVASGEDQVIELQKAAALTNLVAGGMDFYSAVNQVAELDAELQKEAAFNELVGEGYSFDEAVALIESASAQ